MSGEYVRLRQRALELKTGPFGSALSANEYSDDGIPLINPSDLSRGRIQPAGAVKVPVAVAERMAAYRLREGDLVLARRGELGRYGLVCASDEGSLCGTGSLLVRPAPQLSTKFLGYFLETRQARDWLALQSVGSTMDNLSEAILARLPVPCIPLTQQQKIANFLDEQTARIDALIAEKERLASILKHLRGEAIDGAVLGCEIENRGQALKGLEVLGNLPRGWKASRMKYELDYVTSGSRGWADYYADEGALFVRIGNLARDSIALDLGDIQRVALPSAAEGLRARIRPGDLLISITAYLGSVAVAPGDIDEAYVSQHVSLARPNGIRAHPEWLGYVVLSSVGKTYFDLQAYGGTKIQLSLNDIRELPVPLPPLEEQVRRISHLTHRLEQLNMLGEHVSEHIGRLREYRSSLISAAVTGQIDVGSFRAPATEEMAA